MITVADETVALDADDPGDIYADDVAPLHDGPDVVMQTRCVHCLREQYALAMLAVSLGERGCVWCGVTPNVYATDADYQAALSRRRAELDERRGVRHPYTDDGE